jgi:hypothetical protein
LQQQPQGTLKPLERANYSVALKDDVEAKAKVIAAIDYCFALCKTYGKTSEDMEKMQKAFVSMLGEYPHEKVIKAFRTHVERSDEIPTLASIINLIKRNGRPPLEKADIIAINKKDAEYRAKEDWADLREWQEQQRRGWDSETSEHDKISQLLKENEKLKNQIKELEAQGKTLEPKFIGDILKNSFKKMEG